MIISLVLPVYNVEKYLSKCVESCLNQNIPKEQYEIIIVDDGSTDTSGQIGKEYENNNRNVSLIHQQNKGLSGARNTGLFRAKGKYVWFIDSDDWIENNCLADIIEKLEEAQPDTMVINFYKIDQNENRTFSAKKNIGFKENHIYSGTEYFGKRAGDFLNSWRYISNNKFLRNNNLHFYEGIVHEDNEHTPKLLYHAQRVLVYNKPVYAHLIRTGSIMTTFNPKKIDSWYKIFDSMKDFRASISKESEFRTYLNQYLLQQFSNYLTNRNQYDIGNDDIRSLQRLKPLETWPNMALKYRLKFQLIDKFPIQYSRMIITFNRITKS